MANTDKGPVKRRYFSKVREARELFEAKAKVAVRLYMKNIKLAIAKGDHESASKALQWWIEHTPATAEGVTVIDASVDKPKQIQGQSGPTVNIGFQIGGLQQPTLPPQPAESVPLLGPVLDVEPLSDEDSQ